MKYNEDKIVKEIENLNINQLSRPIQVNSGYLIIKLNNKREKEKELDFEKTFKIMGLLKFCIIFFL